jgi:hypothetical protein
MRVDPAACASLSSEDLQKHITRLLDRWEFSFQRCTNHAQDTHFDTSIIEDYQKYIIEYAYMMGVKKESFYYVD